jgi:hypothetical protein
MRRLNGGWVGVIFLPKVKHDCFHGWRRGKRQIWAKHKDEGSFGWHHWPTLCLLWMVQVGKGIKNFDLVPLYIKFASKKLKMMDNYEAWCQLSMKALTCSINYLGVIKSYAIHVKPWRHTNCGGMETCLRRCWGTKTKPSAIESFCKGECRNPNLGLVTKARCGKVAGQEGNPGVTSYAPGSAKSVRKWTLTLSSELPC